MKTTLTTTLRTALAEETRSMREIARQAGISDSQLIRWRRGERDIRLRTADRLAEVLGVRATRKKKVGSGQE